MLEGFLTAYPDDPAADQAAFAAANALLDLKAYKRGRRGLQPLRRALSRRAICWTATGTSSATATSPPASTRRPWRCAARWPRPSGPTRRPAARWKAPTSGGRSTSSARSTTAWARRPRRSREYRRVEDRFADAKEAIAYFLRKAIELPEVTTVKPGEPAEVELKFRNVAACDVKVYRIDLMKFSLLKRNLGGHHADQPGRHPPASTRRPSTLGDGKDYRDRTHKLPLPLKEEGAYLVVCRGDDLHASGLVLVTPLAVEVQEDAASGRVRTTVKDRDGRPATSATSTSR